MSTNGNGHSGFNGNSLASLSGAKLRVEERVTFEVGSLQEAMQKIKQLGGTGQLSISFLNGSAAGTAEWKSSRKQHAD